MSDPISTTKPCPINGIQGFINRTWKSRFVRNVAVVASGTAGAQAVTMAFAPIITRLYGPEVFGILGTFMAIVAVVTPVAALSYPIAIVLPKEDSDAKGIAKLSAYIALGMSAIVTLVLFIAGDKMVELFQIQAIISYIFLIPLVILFAAWMQINKQWLIRKKQFKIIARVVVIQAFLINSAKLGIGFFKPVAAVLIVIYTLGQVLHAFMLSWGFKRDVTSYQRKESMQPKAELWKLARQHYDFPVYRAPQIFINATSQSLPVLMLATFFGPASAGFYVLCKKLLGMPSTLIGQSVGDVFYPRITEAAHSGENLTKLVFKSTMGLALVGFLPYTLVIVFGPWLFGFVFGIEWVVAGKYARWLALWIFFMFINNPSIKALPVIAAQGFHLVFTFFTIAIRLIVLYSGYYVFQSDIIAVALFGTSGALINIVLIALVLLKCAKFDNIQLWRAT